MPPTENQETDKNKPPQRAPKRKPNRFLKYSGLAAEMIGAAVLGGLGGHWLDKQLDWGFPLFTILLLFLGLGGAIRRMVINLQRDAESDEQEQNQGS